MSRLLPFVCAPSYPFAQQWLAALQVAMPDEHVVALEALDTKARATCEVAIVANPQTSDLRTLPNLKWVHSVWAGVERLIHDLRESDLEIVRLIDPQLADTMAEAVQAWTMYLHRDMPRYARQQAARQWLPHDYVRPEDKTVALLGLGELGAACADRLHAVGFNLCGWSRTRKAIPNVQCYAGDEELPTMLTSTDILICLLPLTPQTRGILDAKTFGLIRKGASLINFARGGIIEDEALRAALDGEHLSHAVLDVFNQEPLPEAGWQWQHPRVTVLPHISAPTDRRTASTIVATNIRRYRETGVMPPVVDKERWY
jgi:glyoxylate/hydroxypyruvate reductase A